MLPNQPGRHGENLENFGQYGLDQRSAVFIQ